MTKHPKRPRDPAQLAKLIGDIATGEIENLDNKEQAEEHAVARGVKSGLKGGKARAAALKPDQRIDIAREAVIARWKKGGND